MADEAQQLDSRFGWLKQRVLKALQLKDDKWNHLIENNDIVSNIMTFFENEINQIFFFIAGTEITMTLEPPGFGKEVVVGKERFPPPKRCIFFVKTANYEKVEKDKPIPVGTVMYGDITEDVLGVLSCNMDNVFFPLLKKAVRDWPELLQKDISAQCDHFSQQIQIVRGRQAGKYVLPIPSGVEELLEKLRALRASVARQGSQSVMSVMPPDLKEDVQAVEQIVLEWIKQIRHLVHYQPEDDPQIKNATPSTEVAFWRSKEAMCHELISSVNKQQSQAVQQILEIVKSSYQTALQAAVQELIQEHAQCVSTAQFLGPLDGICSTMTDHTSSEEQLQDSIGAFLKALQHVWYYAPFYGSQQRYTFMIRGLANQVIDWGVKCISNGEPNGRETFKQLDALALAEKLQKIQFVCKIIDVLIEKYAGASAEVQEQMKKIGQDLDTKRQEDDAQRARALAAVIGSQKVGFEWEIYEEKKRILEQLKKEGKVPQSEQIEMPREAKPPQVKYEKHLYRKDDRWPEMAYVFKRLESFVERLKDVHKVMQVMGAFENLNPDRFEVGGPQGEKLSQQLKKINHLFGEKIVRFTESQYDPLDVGEPRFQEDMENFMKHYASLEKRLTAILVTAIESSVQVESAVTCFEVFSDVLGEPILRGLALQHFPLLNRKFLARLQQIRAEFHQQKTAPTLEPNMPPQSGRVFWSRLQLNRVRVPHLKLDALYSVYLKSGDEDDLYQENTQRKNRYNEFVTEVTAYEKEIYEDWKHSVNDKCIQRLDEYLLKKTETEIIGLSPKEKPDEYGVYYDVRTYRFKDQEKELEDSLRVKRDIALDTPVLLATNFSQELFDILAETKLFKILYKEIPEKAQEVYDKGNEYRAVKNQLDDLVVKYNYVQKNLFYVERPLFYTQLRHIEALLQVGTDRLRWVDWKENREDVEQFIQKVQTPIAVLYSQVLTLKDSLKQIEELLKGWAKQPMIERPVKNVLALDKVAAQIQNKCQQFKRENLTKIRQIRDGQQWEVDVDKITTNISRAKNVVFLKEVQDLYTLSDEARKVASEIQLGPEETEQLKAYWEFYQMWLSEYLQTGLLEIIVSNIKQIQRYMDESETAEHNDFYQKGMTPAEQSYAFLEVSMLIEGQNLIFQPGCDPSKVSLNQTSLEGELLKWINEISRVCEIVFNPVSASGVDSIRKSHLNSYINRIHESPKYKQAVEQLLKRVQSRASLANQEQRVCQPYQDLYTTDSRQYLQRFLQDGPNVPLKEEYYPDPDREQKVTRTLVVRQQAEKEEAAAEEEDETRKKPQQEDDGMDAGQVVQEEMTLKYWRKPDMYDFNEAIEKYERLYEQIAAGVPLVIRIGWLQVRVAGARTTLLEKANMYRDLFINNRVEDVRSRLLQLQQIVAESKKTLNAEFSSENFEKAMKTLQEIKSQAVQIDGMFDPMKQIIQMLQRHGKTLDASVLQLFETLPKQWSDVKAVSMASKERLAPLQAAELQKLNEAIRGFSSKVQTFRAGFSAEAPYKYAVGIDTAYQMLDRAILKLQGLRENAGELIQRQQLFEQQFQDKQIQNEELQQIAQMEKELKMLKGVWDLADVVEVQVKEWKKSLFQEVNTESLQDVISKLQKQQIKMDQACRAFNVYKELDKVLKTFNTTIPLITNLRDKSMRERHWHELMRRTKVQFVIDESFRLADLLALNLIDFQEDVSDIVDCARKELVQEVQLETLKNTWKNLSFTFTAAGDATQTPLTSEQIQQMQQKGDMFNVVVPEELAAQLEQDQMMVSAMAGNVTVQYFSQEVGEWQRRLSTLDSIIQTWVAVQRMWSYLKPIFKFSEDIRRQLPEDTKRFEQIDQSWTAEMNKAVLTPNALAVSEHREFLASLERDQKGLVRCEKALSDYLDTKRRLFPRFYFVSAVDLLDILSKGQQPRLVEKHLSKIFDNIHTLKWENPDDMDCKTAVSFLSGEKEEVPFNQNFKCAGQVETWLNELVTQTRLTLRQALSKALNGYAGEESKAEWLERTYAQICIVALQVQWTSDTQAAFDKMAENNEGAMKEYNKKQSDMLMSYIQMIQGKLSSNMRTKMASICTIEVHARDIVSALVRDKVSNAQAFAWQSQLKFYWDEKLQDCVIRICDADFMYSYEYLGCTSRLVITPLTDRCYITLTQSLHLNLGGAPAGPAGTGKTETTKDLGRALGRMVYVFNCSPEMDYKSLGNIFYGLSLSGSWGCFDEFNRISIEVLSVVAMQVKSVLDAIRAKKEFFSLEGDDEEKPNMPKARLNRQVGYFITMNPGYAGRTELPDNLKALFRSVSMVVPDFCQITEIMLISNGFMGARELAKKFTTLYSLNRELLSKQDHYDWGLRAIIAICRTAGTLRRDMIKNPQDAKK